MLARFRKAKQPEIEALARLAAQGTMPEPHTGKRPDFRSALKQGSGIAVIAEYKRASPSRGEIRMDLTVESVARQYEQGGAAAISILTEQEFFGGDASFIGRSRSVSGLPVLRKDFIFDPLQIAATAATEASALLLITRMLPDAGLLRAMREQAESLGLAAVVEIFDLADLELARKAGADIIQVNARDLATLRVDRKACINVLRQAQPDRHEIWIAASGISQAADLAEAEAAGFSAALIGSALMEKPDPGKALFEICKGRRQ